MASSATPANTSHSSEEEKDYDYFDVDDVFARKIKVKRITMNAVVIQTRKVNRLIRVGVDVLDTNATLEFINERQWAPNTKTGYLSSLASVLGSFQEYQEQYRFYSGASVKMRQAITEESDNSLLSPKEKGWPKWSEIDQLYIMGTTAYDRALMAFYTLLPPRRVADVASLRYGETDEGNYITLDYDKVVYSVYKTSATHGVVEIAIPEKLQELLKELDPEEGEIIWPNTMNPSRRLSKAFDSVSDQHITSNILRHSFLSDVLSVPRSTEYKKRLAKIMGHSLSTQQTYIRLDLANNFNRSKKDSSLSASVERLSLDD